MRTDTIMRLLHSLPSCLSTDAHLHRLGGFMLSQGAQALASCGQDRRKIRAASPAEKSGVVLGEQVRGGQEDPSLPQAEAEGKPWGAKQYGCCPCQEPVNTKKYGGCGQGDGCGPARGEAPLTAWQRHGDAGAIWPVVAGAELGLPAAKRIVWRGGTSGSLPGKMLLVGRLSGR